MGSFPPEDMPDFFASADALISIFKKIKNLFNDNSW